MVNWLSLVIVFSMNFSLSMNHAYEGGEGVYIHSRGGSIVFRLKRKNEKTDTVPTRPLDQMTMKRVCTQGSGVNLI